MLIAARLGVHEIIEEITETFPEALYSMEDSDMRDLCHTAIENRSDKVFYLIYHAIDLKHQYLNLTDTDENNPLHKAARLAPQHKLNLVPGAALQMQREIEWYKVCSLCYFMPFLNIINFHVQVKTLSFYYFYESAVSVNNQKIAKYIVLKIFDIHRLRNNFFS